MRTILSLIAAALLAVSLAACGIGADASASASPKNKGNDSEQSAILAENTQVKAAQNIG